MDYIAAFLLGTLVSWVSLLVVLPLAQKFAEFGLPGWRQLLWQVALVAAIVNAVSVGLGPVNGILAWIASSVVFWILMVKWFAVDLFGAVIIVVVNMIISFAAFIFLIAAH